MLAPLLLGLSILTFTISRLVPGDPVGLAAGPQASVEIREALRVQFGLDQPLPIQYLNYIRGVLQGDWGRSLYTRRDVIEALGVFFPATRGTHAGRRHSGNSPRRAGRGHFGHVS